MKKQLYFSTALERFDDTDGDGVESSYISYDSSASS